MDRAKRIIGALLLSVPFVFTLAQPGANPTFLFGLAIIVANVYWFLIRDRHRW